MKTIKLTQNRYALVDDEDYDKLNSLKWYYNGGYARRATKTSWWFMQWSILGKPQKGFVIDHINGVSLDNRKENLRFVTQFQNSFTCHLFH